MCLDGVGARNLIPSLAVAMVVGNDTVYTRYLEEKMIGYTDWIDKERIFQFR